jgi:hypothetical protein
MELDLTGREYLTPFEMTFLVTGLRSLWAADRYAAVTIRAHQGVRQQLSLILRWVDNGVITVIDVLDAATIHDLFNDALGG